MNLKDEIGNTKAATTKVFFETRDKMEKIKKPVLMSLSSSPFLTFSHSLTLSHSQPYSFRHYLPSLTPTLSLCLAHRHKPCCLKKSQQTHTMSLNLNLSFSLTLTFSDCLFHISLSPHISTAFSMVRRAGGGGKQRI